MLLHGYPHDVIRFFSGADPTAAAHLRRTVLGARRAGEGPARRVRTSAPPHLDREPLGAALLPPGRRGGDAAPPPHVPARALERAAGGGPRPAPQDAQRGRRGAALHEREPAPGAA